MRFDFEGALIVVWSREETRRIAFGACDRADETFVQHNLSKEERRRESLPSVFTVRSERTPTTSGITGLMSLMAGEVERTATKWDR